MSLKNHPKKRFALGLAPGSSVLDVGCWTYSFARHCEGLGIKGLEHFGIDRETPEQAAPAGYTFQTLDIDTAPFPFPAEQFDAVVLSHVTEHLSHPMRVMDEVFRVLKPGGLIYLECPSDRSLRLPSMPFKFEEFRSLNFYDDPTHVGRPHSPQSLYRLLRMYKAEIQECRYLTSAAVRIRLPYLLLRSLVMRDAALLEFAVWWSFGFAVYGIARKAGTSSRNYVLSA